MTHSDQYEATIATLLTVAGILMEDGSVPALRTISSGPAKQQQRIRGLAKLGVDIAALTAAADLLHRFQAREGQAQQPSEATS